MANGRRYPPDSALRRRAPTRRIALLFNGQLADVQHGQPEAVAACLFKNLGRAVPYQRLLTAIGRESDNSTSRHLLRQYVGMIRNALVTNKAPYVIAVVHEVGYALCEVAEDDPLPAVSIRRSNRATQVGRNVRRLRIAAGLTQTALAKQAGMDRTHLNRLERDRLVPTLPTLKRLAKTLKVTPRSLL
jgi:DNA-binding XRE family transcriptional regulator